MACAAVRRRTLANVFFGRLGEGRISYRGLQQLTTQQQQQRGEEQYGVGILGFGPQLGFSAVAEAVVQFLEEQ